MKKSSISYFLRVTRLIFLLDIVRYYIQKTKKSSENKRFKIDHPNIALPPDYLIYESFQMDLRKYYYGGLSSAEAIIKRFQKHINLEQARILDWGCGPGRIIRHLPMLLPSGSAYYATDYNKQSIRWCQSRLQGIEFNHNTMEARLPYNSNFFDAIYGISIFTHLSEKMHGQWYAELFRVLKPGGVLMVTTQGDNFKVKLTENELLQYQSNILVVRGKVKEGHRTYSAFHPKDYMKNLFSNVEILEHIEPKPEIGAGWIPQDIWMIRKPI